MNEAKTLFTVCWEGERPEPGEEGNIIINGDSDYVTKVLDSKGREVKNIHELTIFGDSPDQVYVEYLGPPILMGSGDPDAVKITINTFKEESEVFLSIPFKSTNPLDVDVYNKYGEKQEDVLAFVFAVSIDDNVLVTRILYEGKVEFKEKVAPKEIINMCPRSFMRKADVDFSEKLYGDVVYETLKCNEFRPEGEPFTSCKLYHRREECWAILLDNRKR